MRSLANTLKNQKTLKIKNLQFLNLIKIIIQILNFQIKMNTHLLLVLIPILGAKLLVDYDFNKSIKNQVLSM